VSNPNEHERFHYELRFAVAGRIRFLSHLETVDTLLSALRRAGVRIQLSQGMKPKPLIKVAMPRPVGVEAWSDVVEIETPRFHDPDEFAFALTNTLPDGLALQSVRRLEGRYASAASRVAGATFRVALSGIDVPQLETAAEGFLRSESVVVERRSPKGVKQVDVRAVVGDVAVLDPADTDAAASGPVVRFYTRLTAEGSARPDEVIRALAQLAGCELQMGRIVRESITLADSANDLGQVLEPALVGADVPDGPEKPWGAC